MGIVRRVFDAAAIIVGSLMIMAVFVPVGYVLYGHFVPHLLLNGTTRYLYQYREMTGRNDDVSLIPALFKGGEARDQVEAQLLGAGLDSWHTSHARLPPGAHSMQLFRLGAGMIKIVCGSELFVKVGYDGSGTLISATVDQGGACL